MAIHIYEDNALTLPLSEGDLANPDDDTYNGTDGETKDKDPWPWIAYEFIVDADGTIWQTNQPANVTYHCGNLAWNRKSRAVCFLGDFTVGHDTPTEAQLRSGVWLVQHLGKPVVPHKRIVRTACCGDLRARWWRELKGAGNA